MSGFSGFVPLSGLGTNPSFSFGSTSSKTTAPSTTPDIATTSGNHGFSFDVTPASSSKIAPTGSDFSFSVAPVPVTAPVDLVSRSDGVSFGSVSHTITPSSITNITAATPTGSGFSFATSTPSIKNTGKNNVEGTSSSSTTTGTFGSLSFGSALAPENVTLGDTLANDGGETKDASSTKASVACRFSVSTTDGEKDNNKDASAPVSFGGAFSFGMPIDAPAGELSFGKSALTTNDGLNTSVPQLTGVKTGVGFRFSAPITNPKVNNEKDVNAPAFSGKEFSFGTNTTDSVKNLEPASGGDGTLNSGSNANSLETNVTPSVSSFMFSENGIATNERPNQKNENANVSSGFNLSDVAEEATAVTVMPDLCSISTKDSSISTTKITSTSAHALVSTTTYRTPVGVTTPSSPTTNTNNTSNIPAVTTKMSAKMIEPPPKEYQSQTVEQILNSLSSQLESDALQFLKTAQRVAQYDAILRDSQRSLSHLTQQVSRLMIKQGEVDQTLTSISINQQNLSDTLHELENQVNELFVAQSHLVSEDADIERDQAYLTAIGLESKLESMEKDIKYLMDDLNVAQERTFANGRGECKEEWNLLNVMNQQHDALSSLETRVKCVEMDLTNFGEDLGC